MIRTFRFSAPKCERIGILVGALAMFSAASGAAQAPSPAPAAAPPADRAGAASGGASAAEADAAARTMQAELEPKPGGLTAEEVVRDALQHSPALAKTTLEFDRAAANRARAKLAFAPRIDLSAGYTRLSKITPPAFSLGPMMAPDPNPMMDPNQIPVDDEGSSGFSFPIILNQYQAAARLSMPITELFLTILPQLKAAKNAAKVAEHQQAAQALQVSYDARVAFYEYARLLGNESVARASVRVREAGVRDLESLVQAGTATQTELVRARAELATTQVLATQAAGGVVVARERLEQLTGVAIDAERGIGEPFVNVDIGETPNLEQVHQRAKQVRPELAALRSLEQVREQLLQSRKGAMYPQIRGTGGVLSARPHPRFVPAVDQFNTTFEAGVNVSWSPNDFALNYTQASDAESDLRSVREDRRLVEQGIAVEAASAVVAHGTAAANISATTQALDAARRYEADQRALLLAGAATPNDVLLAQRDLLAASLDWVNAFIAGRVAQAALLKAEGKTGLSTGSASSAR